MHLDVAKLYTFAWRHAPKVPEPVLRAAFTLVADVTWCCRTQGVRRLEANYARVRPDLDGPALRRLTRAGMRSYMRYFREAFTLQGATPEQVTARVRVEGLENLQPHVDAGRGVSLALAHLGNWDLAGAYASAHIAPVLTVAERLKPEELFQEFVAFRRSLGIEALPLGDADVFRSLVRGGAAGGVIIPLLADRDLTARGIEVDLCGHRARVAAGPATLALTAKVPLVPVGITYERLTGERRRVAGTAWGIVLRFYPEVPVPDVTTAAGKPDRRAQAALMTQGWVDAVGRTLVESTQDWHMLQRVFVDDLDQERYARTQAADAREARAR
ncbi:phosphatidylinositol mannoside acyltransferase [Isoptericola cucumis]|uniref:Lipid A biosynthesis lauroyl acyltransferase n=1 Tax=Isoptericola cucumis TaxID=1776856 RepID=A0ABQ2BEJ2_9MICO|nr:phosphatidylinositol mannoside acyltransferase [Isoptericola cucumis]GGI12002.1 lipid A biosynthesis lauroyl acyltransferase [Isoptericola cucumis]